MPAQKTRENLIEAATEVFAEKGFSGARIDEIAGKARANKAMIYYHYGTKKDLYQAVLLRLFSNLQSEMRRIARREAAPPERLMALYAGLSAVFSKEPALPRIMLREILVGGRHLDAATVRAFAGIFELVRSTLEQGMREGVFRRVNPLLVHLNLAGTLLIYSVSEAFRERMVSAKLPDVTPPTHETLLDYLNELATRTLAVEEPGGSDRS